MDKTAASNLALSHLGSGKQIEDLETTHSQEADACNQFESIALKKTLRAFPWPFATKYADLTLVTTRDIDDSHPTDDFKYQYRYPSDCLFLRRICNPYSRLKYREHMVPYKLTRDATARSILTDLDDARIEYTMNLTDFSFFPDDFVMAYSYMLASLIAPRLSKGDAVAKKDQMMKMFFYEISLASATAQNEEQSDELVDSQMTNSRDI